MKIYMYDCLICEMMIRLLQRIDWLQCKICREWTLDFENSKFWSTHYEIEIISVTSWWSDFYSNFQHYFQIFKNMLNSFFITQWCHDKLTYKD